MSEQFAVSTTALGAMAVFVGGVATESDRMQIFASNFCHAETRDFGGLILPRLIGPLDGLATTTLRRWDTISTDLRTTSTELAATCIRYFNQDQANARNLPGSPASDGMTDAPVSFAPPTSVSLNDPPRPGIDVHAIAGAVADWLADCNEAIARLAGWDPIGEALDKVAGNWMALETIVAAYGTAGDALDVMAADLTRGYRTMDPHWDGRAAQSFGAYLDALSRGMQWEAAIGRLIHHALFTVANELNDAAVLIVQLIKQGFERFVRFDSFTGILKTAARFVPGAGTAATVAEITKMIHDIYTTVQPLIDKAQSTVDAVMEFIAFVKDPIAEGRRRVDGFTHFTETLEDAQRSARAAKDIVTAADVSRVSQQPKAGFDAGKPADLTADGT